VFTTLVQKGCVIVAGKDREATLVQVTIKGYDLWKATLPPEVIKPPARRGRPPKVKSE
jgi:hypothetical protein